MCLPVLAARAKRGPRGGVGQHLAAEPLVTLTPQPGPVAEQNDLDTGRRAPRNRLGTDRADLLDLPVCFGEAEPRGEGQRAWICDAGPDRRKTQLAQMTGEGAQQDGPDAVAAEGGQHPRRDESDASGIRRAGQARAGQPVITAGEQQQPVRGGATAQLLGRVASFAWVDGHAHLPPRLIPGIRLNRPQRGSHASDGTHRPGDVLQPTEWIICTHGPTYAYCFSRHSYSAGRLVLDTPSG
jgi:hypothetical protein